MLKPHHEPHSLCTHRFDNGLLFVLATSNLLVHPSQLQDLLVLAYQGLELLLGPSSMQVSMAPKLEALKRKLRALGPLLDVLIADDSLVPCLMLVAPQVRVGQPPFRVPYSPRSSC